MKLKTCFLIVIALIICILVKNKSDNIVIPKESIRIRIIASSNDTVDISEKIKVKKSVEKELYSLLKEANNVNEAKSIINNNLERLNLVIDDTTDLKYDVNFGNNYFPKKVYKGVIYDEGMYDSLVITLGSGRGDNWWCVLFPPLCLLDSNETTNDVEYKFFVKELIDKYFN
ncbi:MAG: stage II sporulation protein R [Bacilli bacterium]|nr:stage II sporulation protein R [Bacilli bacterium]